VIVPSKSVKKMNLGLVFIAGRLEGAILDEWGGLTVYNSEEILGEECGVTKYLKHGIKLEFLLDDIAGCSEICARGKVRTLNK
jgi:hypothetical protein